MNQHQKAGLTTPANNPGILYIVPTPIGNLADITQRALTILAQVDFVAAEDTRHSGLLLQHFAIKAHFLSLHDHNEQQKSQLLVAHLLAGKQIALISDAGTPLINDPGYHLVSQCRAQGIQVVPLPGACAAITALSAAGLPSNRFCYEGFLPSKASARLTSLMALVDESRTLIFYESPRRVIATLQDMQTVWGAARYVVLARELTKTWEAIYGAPVGELLLWLAEDENRYKGEIVLLVKGGEPADSQQLPSQALQTLALLQQELPLKKAAALTAQIHQVKKNSLYQYALSQQTKQT